MADASTKRTKDSGRKIKKESRNMNRDLRRTASRAKMEAINSATYEAGKNFKEAIKEDARRIKDRTKEGYSNKMSDAEMYVIENPMKAVGIAAGIGAFIGLILGASMASKKDVNNEYRRRWDDDY